MKAEDACERDTALAGRAGRLLSRGQTTGLRPLSRIAVGSAMNYSVSLLNITQAASTTSRPARRPGLCGGTPREPRTGAERHMRNDLQRGLADFDASYDATSTALEVNRC
jgi:hypothetical protein